MAAGGSLPWLQEAEWGRERREESAQGFPGQQKTEPMEDVALFEQRNKFCVGDSIEIMKPDGRNVAVTVEAMYNEEGEAVESCPHARQKIWVKLSEAPAPYDLLRVANGGRTPKP